MHELSLAQSMLDQLMELAAQHKAKSITTVKVVLGPFSGVVADSFAFGFDILKKEHTLTKEAKLILETPPPEYQCKQCGTIITLPDMASNQLYKHPATSPLACSNCDGQELFPRGGNELILQQLEME